MRPNEITTTSGRSRRRTSKNVGQRGSASTTLAPSVLSASRRAAQSGSVSNCSKSTFAIVDVIRPAHRLRPGKKAETGAESRGSYITPLHFHRAREVSMATAGATKVRGMDASYYFVKDMARARKFYDQFLGMEPTLTFGEDVVE